MSEQASQQAPRISNPIVDELTYRNFAANRRRDPSLTAERYARFVSGVDVAAFTERFEREQGNAGARMADDVFCSGCGARGSTLCANCR